MTPEEFSAEFFRKQQSEITNLQLVQ